MRIIILAIDENDFFVPAGDKQLAAQLHAQIAGAQPAVSTEQPRIGFRIAEIAVRHVVATNLDVADVTFAKRRVVVVGETNFGVRDAASDRYQADALWIGGG